MSSKRPQRWKDLMKDIYHNLNVGDSMTLECTPKERELIRSGLSDRARYAYRGKGVYKTKSKGVLFTITRATEGDFIRKDGRLERVQSVKGGHET